MALTSDSLFQGFKPHNQGTTMFSNQFFLCRDFPLELHYLETIASGSYIPRFKFKRTEKSTTSH